MNKKLFIFLSAVIFTATTSLVAMEQDKVHPTINDLPDAIISEIVGHLSDNPRDVCNVSLVSKRYFEAARGLRRTIIEMRYGRDTRLVSQLDITNLGDYRTAIVRYMILYEIRQKPACFKFQQDEFVALQDFIISVLEQELQKPVAQIDFVNYVHVPLALKINFQNIIRSNGETPLFVAAEQGCLRAVKALLKAGSDVNKACTDDGSTPLCIASFQGRLQVVQALLRAGADVNKACTDNGITPLYTASYEGHLQVVQALLKAGADVNKARTDGGGETPLYIASFQGHLQVVQALLRVGADVNKACTDYVRTPLHGASYNRHLQVVQALLDADADVNIKISDSHPRFPGYTALQVAQEKGFDEIVQAIQNEKTKRERIRGHDQIQLDDSRSCSDSPGEPESKRGKKE